MRLVQAKGKLTVIPRLKHYSEELLFSEKPSQLDSNALCIQRMQFMMELEIDLLALDQPESIDGFCALEAANVFFGLESLNDFLTQAATHRVHKYERSEGLNMSIQRCTLLSNCKSDIFDIETN
ncbi:hypothetical protein GmHk_19G055202 [Glycine max]|nr:hypothetical protein GmHk_19G055202 [Glycine max]